jgi:hypothetical protein
MTCTPSARLEAEVPRKDTAYSREGTIAHSVAETLLREFLKKDGELFEGHVTLEWPDTRGYLLEIGGEKLAFHLAEASKEGLDSDEMLETVSEGYCHFVWEDYQEAKAKDPEARLLVEATLKLDEYIPESFGSSDAVIIAGKFISVYDLKYGKGVKVSAENNSQMMCYALGALLGPGELYDIRDVEMTIIQPRLSWVSTWHLEASRLLSWAEDILKPAAVTAFQGEGAFVPGDHCKFCAVAPRCKALGMHAALIRIDRTGDLMTDEEIAKALHDAQGVKSWIAALEQYALDQAMADKAIPGFKVVEGRSVRQISNPEAAICTLAAAGFDESSYLRRDLKSITDLERLLGKKGFNSILGEYVIKPQGRPTLVEDTDPRPAMNSTASAINDFKNVNV